MNESIGRKAPRDKRTIFQGIQFHEPVAEDKEERLRIMAERASKGLDLWTGGEADMSEQPVESLEK